MAQIENCNVPLINEIEKNNVLIGIFGKLVQINKNIYKHCRKISMKSKNKIKSKIRII